MTIFDLSQFFRLTNYDCHRTDRLTAGGGTAILVRRGVVHYAIPVLRITSLDATAIQVKLAVKPAKNLPAQLSPSRPLFGVDLRACFGGGLPVDMAGILDAKHVVYYSQLNMRWGNSYVIMPMRTPV
jgi:hypothetical protein